MNKIIKRFEALTQILNYPPIVIKSVFNDVITKIDDLHKN